MSTEAPSTNQEVFVAGVYNDIPAVKYHAAPGISKSALDQSAKSPAHYQAWLKEKPEQTPAMRIGTLAHLATFQPDLYARSVAMAPIVDRRTKDGKAIWQQFQSENEGRELVTVDEQQMLTALSGAVRRHPLIGKLLNKGDSEVSVFSKDTPTGLVTKCRFDWINPEDGVFLDLKTTEDASPTGFARSIGNFRYHIQDAHYTQLGRDHGMDFKFIFVAVEKHPPYAVAIYVLDEATRIQAEAIRRQQLETLASCETFQSWPAYSTEIQTLSLKQWQLASPEK